MLRKKKLRKIYTVSANKKFRRTIQYEQMYLSQIKFYFRLVLI